MDNGIDDDVPASVQAARASADAWRQKRMDDRGVGLSSLYFALMKAYEKIAPIIEADTQGARGKYAKYDAILKAVRKPLMDQGVLIAHGSKPIHQVSDGANKILMMPVYTDLIHVQTGEVRTCSIDMPVIKHDPQAAGSAFSYGKRYTLLAALALATGEDDDGKAAMPSELPDRAEPDTPRVVEIKGEIAALKDAEAMVKWRGDPKVDKRIKALSDGEMDAVKRAWFARKEAIDA